MIQTQVKMKMETLYERLEAIDSQDYLELAITE